MNKRAGDWKGGLREDLPVYGCMWWYISAIFFFDKAKRQRFILQNEALALVELKRKKIVLRQCANAPMRQNCCRRKITGQRYFKNGCVGHVIDTARGEKSLL